MSLNVIYTIFSDVVFRIVQGSLSLAPDAEAKPMPTIKEEAPKPEPQKEDEDPEEDDLDFLPEAGAILNEVGLSLDDVTGDIPAPEVEVNIEQVVADDVDAEFQGVMADGQEEDTNKEGEILLAFLC